MLHWDALIYGIIFIVVICFFPITFVIVFNDIYQNKLKYKYPWDKEHNSTMAFVAFIFITCVTPIVFEKIMALVIAFYFWFNI